MQREQVEELFYGKANQQRRFTQDFPILPDVWIAYGAEPSKRQELLLTPHNESDAPTLARGKRMTARLSSGARLGSRLSVNSPPMKADVIPMQPTRTSGQQS